MSLKKRIIDQIIFTEGGYVNDPDDSGGKTKYGITEEVARKYGYTGAMLYLPREIAFDIYTDRYWHKLKADSLQHLSEGITEEVVDTGVNMGTHKAAILLQTCLNVFNNKEQYYKDLKVDGHIGSATIGALSLYLSIRDEEVLLKALNCLQGAFYIELANTHKKNESFVYGWLKQRVRL